MTVLPTWTADLAAAANAVFLCEKQTRDAGSRAWEMQAFPAGRQLVASQVSFVSCLRQRLSPSPAATAFEEAWGDAYRAAREAGQ